MNGDDLIRVGWALLKSEFAIKPIKMLYTPLHKAYQVYAVSLNYGLSALIVDPMEVADFETNYRANAAPVRNGHEAVAVVQLPQVSPSTLNSQDSGRSFGYVETSAAAPTPVRASTYVAPGINAKRSVKSTDTNDAAGGTGARAVKITYLDEILDGPFTETVVLDGTNAVDTVADNVAFIEKIEVVEVGSGGGNAGTVEVYAGPNGSGSVVGSILPSDNRTYWAHHYVPAKKMCNVMGSVGSSSAIPGTLTLTSINPVNALIPRKLLDVPMRHGTADVHRPRSVPILVEGPALIVLNEQAADTTPSTTHAGFSWIQF